MKTSHLRSCLSLLAVSFLVSMGLGPSSIPAGELHPTGAACNCDDKDTYNCRDLPHNTEDGEACGGSATLKISDENETDDLEGKDSGSKDCDDADCSIDTANYEWDDDC